MSAIRLTSSGLALLVGLWAGRSPGVCRQLALGSLSRVSGGQRISPWAVAPLAGEWIHYAALAIKTATPLAVLRDTVAQFPTFSEAYLKAIDALEH